MTRITLVPTTSAALDRAKEPVELCDTSGRVPAYFRPSADESLFDRVRAPFTDEELDRFEREPGGRPLSEMLTSVEDGLRKLGNDD